MEIHHDEIKYAHEMTIDQIDRLMDEWIDRLWKGLKGEGYYRAFSFLYQVAMGLCDNNFQNINTFFGQTKRVRY